MAELKSSTDKAAVEASDDLKCFSKCVSDKIGIFNGDSVNIDRLVEINVAAGMDEAKVRASAEQCKRADDTKIDCKAAFDMYACFIKHNL